jgi:hypothetical protein
MNLYSYIDKSGHVRYTRNAAEHPEAASCAVNDENKHLVTLEEINIRADYVVDWLKTERGYDATRRYGWSGLPELHVDFFLDDDFQKDVPIDKRQRHGSYSMTIPELFSADKLARWPSRETRELAVLAATATISEDFAAELVGAQAAIFVAELVEQSARINALLGAPK